MGLGDVLFGRKKLKEPAADRLFAITTAAVTLDVDCSLKPAGVGAVIFKPLSAGEFTQVDTDIEELLQGVAKESGSTLDRKKDTFGFEWVVVHDPDLEDQVTAVHAVASELRSAASAGSCSPRRSASTAAASRLLDLRLQDRHVLAVRADRREAAARQRARAGAEGEAREGAPGRAGPHAWLALYDAPI